ncbi:hypothetical protein F8388_010151 [Cannabis sativa]|uniref:Uncharacterized protein n=1 Tax=Cannabis sativa TaxID=3483 RepID=A0A7J6GRN9_CANSA|nr:hypothetical protein F8388_010151 [Cannabis sativa]
MEASPFSTQYSFENWLGATGLELSNRPFLWVVRDNNTKEVNKGDLFPEGFLEGVASHGLISYICDVWKTGLGFDRHKSGIITRDEIRIKVKRVINDEEMKERVLRFKEMAAYIVEEDGSSNKNFRDFVEWHRGALDLNE